MGVKPGPYVMLAVSDTGVGMDAETRSRLVRAVLHHQGAGKGSGLGLSTVYGAIKQADGQVTVYSQPNCGTIFEIYLPRVKEAVAEAAAARLGQGLRDDSAGGRRGRRAQALLAVLKSNGYDVLEAGNGDAALAAYEKNAHKVDMVLTDVVMPQMNGFELGQQLASARRAEDPLHVRVPRQCDRRGRWRSAARLPAQAVHARCAALESPRSARREPRRATPSRLRQLLLVLGDQHHHRILLRPQSQTVVRGVLLLALLHHGEQRARRV